MQKSNQKTYNCFSPNLFKHLVAHNNFPVACYEHHKTRKEFWVFIKTDQLKEALSKYGNNSQAI